MTDVPEMPVFPDVVRGEATNIEQAILYYGNDLGRLVEWMENHAGALRSADFNYEFRHPGHGDQSVHNPHKGGSSSGGWAAGKWTALSDSEVSAMHQRVADDWMKANPDKVGDPFYRDNVVSLMEIESKGQIIYQNGNVQVRFKAGQTQYDDAKVVMDGVDEAMSFTPLGMRQADYPLEVKIAPLKSTIRGNFVGDSPAGGVITLNDLYVTKGGILENQNPLGYKINSAKSIYGDTVSFFPEIAYGKSAVKSTVYHEMGHAVMAFNNETTIFGMPGMIKLGYISKYAKKNKFERYAETFRAFVWGQRDSVTAQFEKSHGWVAP